MNVKKAKKKEFEIRCKEFRVEFDELIKILFKFFIQVMANGR